MKHLSVLFIFVCSFTLLQAQQIISLGFKGGINIPGLSVNSSNPVVSGYKTLLSPSYGAVLECGLNKKWSILTEINYANTTVSKNGSQEIPKSGYESFGLTDLGNTNLYSNFYSKIQLRYLEAPLMLKYYIYQNDKINFFVNGGVFAGILFYGNVKTQGRDTVYTNAAHTTKFLPFPVSFNLQSLDVIDWLNAVNFGLQAGLGFTMKSDFGELFANLTTTHGLMNIQMSSGDGVNKTKSLNLAVGYLFHLSK
jgi:hypothetical protein